jgi:hypothetical protein
VVGQTEVARQKKGHSEGSQWNRESLLAELERQRGAEEAAVARRIFEWVDEHTDLKHYYGSGKRDGSFQAGLYNGKAYLFPFALYTHRGLEVQFHFIKRRPPFDDPDLREQLRQRLDAIPNIDLPPDAVEGRPGIPLSALVRDDTLNQVLAVFDWAFDQSRAAAATAVP